MQHSFKEFHPSNQAETLRKNFPARLPGSQLEKPRSQEPGQPALSYEHIENFTKDSEANPGMYLNTGAEVGTVNEDFGAVSQMHLTRTLQCSSTYGTGYKANPVRSCK
ncbi:unnamed protein product, partial [Porites evermanni]